MSVIVSGDCNCIPVPLNVKVIRSNGNSQVLWVVGAVLLYSGKNRFLSSVTGLGYYAIVV